MRQLSLAVLAGSLLVSTSVLAQDGDQSPPVAPEPMSTEPSVPAPTAPEAEAPEVERDGVRFRGGVTLLGGGYFGTLESTTNLGGIETTAESDLSGGLGVISGNIGIQINDLIGVYAVPHLGGGNFTLSVGDQSASEGALNVAATVLVDFTFIDQVFVGVGGGASIIAPTCTNCNGLGGGVLHIRAGGYPVFGFGNDGIRRQGLMVSADLKVNFLNVIDGGPGVDQSVIAVQPMIAIGYEAF